MSATDKLREEILKDGHVRRELIRWEGSATTSVKASIQQIVEIPIDDLMALIESNSKELLDKIELEAIPEKVFDWQPNPQEVHRQKWWRIGHNAAVDEYKTKLNQLRKQEG